MRSRTTSSSTDSKTETKEGADTVTSSKSSDEKTSDTFHADNELDHLVAIDVKWFLKLRAIHDEIYYAVFSFHDTITKNEEKIARPKGSSGGGSAMGMY